MDNIMEISHLHKSFGAVKAVQDLNFCVKKGELFAFLGVNGAGKSTTINIMCGELRKDSGSVLIGGADLDKGPDSIRRKYHQPTASAIQVAYYIFKDLLCKAGFFFASLLRRNPEVVDYYRKVNKVKQIIELAARDENETI